MVGSLPPHLCAEGNPICQVAAGMACSWFTPLGSLETAIKKSSSLCVWSQRQTPVASPRHFPLAIFSRGRTDYSTVFFQQAARVS